MISEGMSLISEGARRFLAEETDTSRTFALHTDEVSASR